jgi:hypothetical protein
VGARETLRDAPTREYLVGVLYPRDASLGVALQDEADDSTTGSVGEETPDDPITMANQRMPSSAGLSFFVAGTSELDIDAWAARYEETAGRTDLSGDRSLGAGESEADGRGAGGEEEGDLVSGGRKGWARISLASPDDPMTIRMRCDRQEEDIFGGRARLHAKWRPVGGSSLVTVTLLNARTHGGDSRPPVEDCLFQVGFRCRPVGGTIGEYPRPPMLREDVEIRELELLYNEVRAYAVGHGCAADWTEGRRGCATEVHTAFVPTFELPAIIPRDLDLDVLKAARLAEGGAPRKTLIGEMREFLSDYGKWADERRTEVADLAQHLRPAANHALEKIQVAAKRIEDGISLLAHDDEAWQAFRLANLAILMQFRHSQADLGGSRHRRDDVTIPDLHDLADSRFRWRPFQLAFQLMVLPSVTDVNDACRETVDLLWFPTGGGKTEAYLGLAAYEAFLRRLRDPKRGAGTAIITRYTLRLLTSQQFQRAASLLCACELIRQEREAVLGEDRMSIGLWVGEGAVPNKFVKAHELYEEMLGEERPENKFQLERCPWCGTEMVPPDLEKHPEGSGIRSTDTSFEFFCPTAACPFHQRLPINVIDEALYEDPPTMLVATVDKLARLAWEHRAGSLLGSEDHDPPSLVIQDELHLLSGPLGTIAGVYEAAIETLLAIRGSHAKILASTATIRNSGEQVAGLFGRDVSLFPPSGLAYKDSFFAALDEASKGRQYVGVMAPSHTMQTTIVHLAALLMQAVKEVDLTEEEVDAFWTLVMYHNSLRELGGAVTMAHDDIPARVRVVATAEDARRRIDDDDVVELTSNVPGRALPGILDRLAGKDETASPVAILLATNMLSVGVDIQRLALMLVNGQPKLTSEYIQATSRVGRSGIPGLIVTALSPGKPRDRSHYEGFRQYHASLYRHVEPSSVTPFSLPARKRALHAGVVIVVRHGLGLCANEDAGCIVDVADRLSPLLDSIAAKITLPESTETIAVRGELDELIDEWVDMADAARRDGKKLYYSASSRKNHHSLLCDYGSGREGWETLHSMRNVDRQCNIRVKGED